MSKSKHKDGGRRVFWMDTPLGAVTTTVWDDCEMCGQVNDQPEGDMCKECAAYCGMGCWDKKIPTTTIVSNKS